MHIRWHSRKITGNVLWTHVQTPEMFVTSSEWFVCLRWSLPRGAMQGLLVSSVGDGIKEFAFKHRPRRVLLAVAAILLACASVVALHEVGAHTQLCVAGSCAHATPFPAVQLRAGACFTLLSPKWVLIIASFTAYTAYRRQIVEGESAPACALAGTVCH